jgi:hypothetical protein
MEGYKMIKLMFNYPRTAIAALVSICGLLFFTFPFSLFAIGGALAVCAVVGVAFWKLGSNFDEVKKKLAGYKIVKDLDKALKRK